MAMILFQPWTHPFAWPRKDFYFKIYQKPSKYFQMDDKFHKVECMYDKSHFCLQWRCDKYQLLRPISNHSNGPGQRMAKISEWPNSKWMANFWIWPFADFDFSILVNGHGHSPLSTIIKLRMVKQDRLRIRARVNSKLGLGHFRK